MQLIAQIRREKEEARGSLADFLSASGVSSFQNYVQELVEEEKETGDRGG